MPYQSKQNSVKTAIREGRTALGMYVAIPSPVIVELAGLAGLDFVRIDCAHSPLDGYGTEQMIRAAETQGITPFVRINYDEQKISKVLEMGAMGIIVPGVSTAEAAREVVNAAKFSPIGERGMFVGPRSSGYGSMDAAAYTNWSNQEVMVAVQIESAQAIENLEEIMNVPGIDMVLSGRGDLANSLKVTGQRNHPLVLEAEQKIFSIAQSKGIAVSVNLDPTDVNFAASVEEWREKGAQAITFGHDLTLIRKTFEQMVNTSRVRS
ncbi:MULTISPECIES: aldolase/citrate lyase family protein [unclassified Paenibacillus]|uniref:HpcH/HpaI aldolase family protein n=1 Tax=unclassified Paenibacillus TaxID=185978 RepID=UPI001AE4FE8F|nr:MULTISPECIES: aldolase/citrate lyase family protein [unclassified Paenibacillus]MBP1155840.1 4-hydroxy-2-oxoheptanedioate aldolase [Paenibacillus sp. PvP091]MBP1168774.1 4-hydroxy-2-oxoheptanedioate aldolase [Paenibacillus sp. PvR098]MBP2439802.1 4-hydroxy-2-oxoheptanedioate aldolase [Paenibacillus sp. PvP052]